MEVLGIMNYNTNIVNATEEREGNSNTKKKKEIGHLNIQILDKISLISITDDSSDTRLNKIQILKEIITSQRQEISWKNDDLKNFEGMIVKMSIELFDFEKKIQENQQIIERLKSERSEDYRENKLQELNLRISTLESENTSLKNTINTFEESQNTEQLEKELKKLKIRIAELELTNKKSEETNGMLKAALLMTVEKETKNMEQAPKSIAESNVVEIKTSNDKTVAITEGPSTVKAPVEEETEQLERKRKCPKCGATSAFILEIDDKEHVIYVNMGKTIYGKKYKCGDCRHEWK